MNQEMKNMERVLIIGVELDTDTIDIENSLDELEELVKAAGGMVISRVVQKKESINPAYFIGKGKAEEIKNYCEELDITTVVFNDELSGAQLRNLEKIIDKKIVDRTNLILDIFASRANSKEGKLQVKLAQLKYRLPRLIGFRDYLSRTGGGIGTRGPGEQKLETDRRHILREVDNIEKQLKEVEQNRNIKRKKREDSNLPIVALVGYTNAGKSTLLNKIIELNDEYEESKQVFVKDMLFATLDTSLRRAKLHNGQGFLLTDTVGFVSKLPTKLIEAFKGTLEEVKYADLLLHIVDASNKDLDIQIQTTYNILKDLDVLDKPILTVFNKMDKVDIHNLFYDSRYVDNKLFISAKNGENIDRLLESIEDLLPQQYKMVTIKIPYQKQNIVNYFCDNYQINSLEYLEDGTMLKLTINKVDLERYKEYII
ncbi:GTP-binding protein HflX [Tissierella praeacuta DSM 18095]|uniref:GTPase HflX n=2 Tax=Tissierella praeacuta TaxID=43131 RepID=A0A1M4SWS7_9FIRM|nr:GTPase HflX [Tissierella praeacuta]TCU70736.1 GTP-binding protein HflX [Tissierella praeacuta]SHE36661.1 GTP-binding protein HflX [Tissierella praeacuta DSM 18095]SUP01845.1 GTP-binding protein HflX [Tissierella praeacuta]